MRGGEVIGNISLAGNMWRVEMGLPMSPDFIMLNPDYTITYVKTLADAKLVANEWRASVETAEE